MRKVFVALAAIIFLMATSAFAGTADVTQTIKSKIPALTTPQKKVKALPKSVVAPQGQETETGNSESQPTETQQPQGEAVIRFQALEFSQAFPNSLPCELKWVVTLKNEGTAASGSGLFIRPGYRKSDNELPQMWPDIQVLPIEPGATAGYTGFVPSRDKGENTLQLTVYDGGTIVTGGAWALPAAVMPTATNVALGDAAIATSQLSFVVQNTGSVSLTPIEYRVRGVVDASGVSEHITAGTINCVPDEGSTTVAVPIPANPYQGYMVLLVLPGTSNVIAERVYPRQ